VGATAAVGAVLIAAAAAWPAGIMVAARALRHGSGQSRAESRDAAAYADGAPPGFTGGFGEQACDACHFEAALNTKPGEVTLTGVPERFVAGERYPLTITLSRPEMAMAGFQLAARLEKGGAQAGTLAPGPGEEGRIRIEPGAVQYANQRQEGTSLVELGVSKWTVVWTAPTLPAAVLFHVAANAADKDEAARGDYVYTATAASRPR
jgi:hypothetical protein